MNFVNNINEVILSKYGVEPVECINGCIYVYDGEGRKTRTKLIFTIGSFTFVFCNFRKKLFDSIINDIQAVMLKSFTVDILNWYAVSNNTRRKSIFDIRINDIGKHAENKTLCSLEAEIITHLHKILALLFDDSAVTTFLDDPNKTEVNFISNEATTSTSDNNDMSENGLIKAISKMTNNKGINISMAICLIMDEFVKDVYGSMKMLSLNPTTGIKMHPDLFTTLDDKPIMFLIVGGYINIITDINGSSRDKIAKEFTELCKKYDIFGLYGTIYNSKPKILVNPTEDPLSQIIKEELFSSNQQKVTKTKVVELLGVVKATLSTYVKFNDKTKSFDNFEFVLNLVVGIPPSPLAYYEGIIQKNTTWEHFKGKLYMVLGLAIDVDNDNGDIDKDNLKPEEINVIYTPIDNVEVPKLTYSRKLSEFIAKVDPYREDNKTGNQFRFTVCQN